MECENGTVMYKEGDGSLERWMDSARKVRGDGEMVLRLTWSQTWFEVEEDRSLKWLTRRTRSNFGLALLEPPGF